MGREARNEPFHHSEPALREGSSWFHGYHLVLLENGRELRMSRYQDQVAERLGLRKPRG
jgi:hypothetical protein